MNNANNMQWISVEDNLPFSGYYLAFRPKAPQENEIATIQYNPHYLGWSGNFEVTHWMPLPKPPQEQSE